MKNILFIFTCLILSMPLLGQVTINTMFYNILDYPEAPPVNRATILQSILADYQPDLFLVCELTSEEGANSILNVALERSDNRYKKAEFVSNQSNANVDLQQMAFYNSQKLSLTNQKVITTHLRDINHYTFLLNTEDQAVDPVVLEVFVTHLKSSEGAANELQRLEMVQDFTTTLLSIPTDHYVIFAGDLNLYTGQEAAYQELLDPSNAIALKDPIAANGKWHNNSNYQAIHTQATRLEPIGSHGAGGGLDDRFDFVLLSENLMNSNSLSYKYDSYKAYGNTGNCYNKAINDPTCAGDYPQDLRNLLHDMSDHLPVVLQLSSNKTLSVSDEITASSIQFMHGNMIQDELALQIDPALLGKKLTIYSILGQVLYSQPLHSNQLSIDATQFNNGIYYIAISSSSHTPLKFIKH